jgi:hypothetical protein
MHRTALPSPGIIIEEVWRAIFGHWWMPIE